MKHKITGSLVTTLFCAFLILGVGYVGIVQSGKLLLDKEQKPQKAVYEQTGPKVFYSKMGDDVPLFPWNYYEQNGVEKLTEEFLVKSDVAIYMGEGRYYPLDPEVTAYINHNFYSMIAESCGVSLETIVRLYEEKNSGIMENISVSQNEYGTLFFYQDNLTVGEKQYQVKLAFSEYQPVSFLCTQSQEEDVRETEQWQKGKEKLVNLLDKFPEEFLTDIYAMECWDCGNVSYYGKDKKSKIEESMYQMNDGIAENFKDAWYSHAYIEYIRHMQEMLQEAANEDGNTSISIGESTEKTGETAYTYQVIERKDVILLLIESDRRVGIYYDPVSQKFCGYNYFY